MAALNEQQAELGFQLPAWLPRPYHQGVRMADGSGKARVQSSSRRAPVYREAGDLQLTKVRYTKTIPSWLADSANPL